MTGGGRKADMGDVVPAGNVRMERLLHKRLESTGAGELRIKGVLWGGRETAGAMGQDCRRDGEQAEGAKRGV